MCEKTKKATHQFFTKYVNTQMVVSKISAPYYMKIRIIYSKISIENYRMEQKV